jgi:transposase
MEPQIREWISKEVDLTLAELCERLAEHGISIKISGLWSQLDKWNLSFKKNTARQRARTERRAGSACAMAEDSTDA